MTPNVSMVQSILKPMLMGLIFGSLGGTLIYLAFLKIRYFSDDKTTA
jgi:hypothetical protein